MRVSDIWEEVIEVIGGCSESVAFRTLTRAIELLANKGLFDPLIGTLDFVVDNGYLIALPRDVKTPLRLNINNNPSFARSRIYEFSPNGAGTVDGPEVGWQWHERGYAVIQDQTKLPSVLRYKVSALVDEGKTLRLTGVAADGNIYTETLIGALTGASESVRAYKEIKSVAREATTREVFLLAAGGTLARYYPDEEVPEFRVIKLSKTGVAVRMLYRKHVFKITSKDDIIPLHSSMAVIRAVDAVRLMMMKKYADATVVMEEAAKMISEEQSSRDEGETLSATIEVQSAINTNINTNDVLIVADVYDMAAGIFEGIGKDKIFDRITDAVNILSNKAQWESLIGCVDLMRSQNCGEIVTPRTRGRQDGYFALPRYVGSVLAVNVNGQPGVPRNRWFEYHVNGTGSTRFASCGTWDEAGDVAIINRLPRESCGSVIPTRVIAVPDDALDEDTAIRIYGTERLATGREVEVWRDGKLGWTCPCVTSTDFVHPSDAPWFTSITRITRDATAGFVSLYAINPVSAYATGEVFLDPPIDGINIPPDAAVYPDQFGDVSVTNVTALTSSVMEFICYGFGSEMDISRLTGPLATDGEFESTRPLLSAPYATFNIPGIASFRLDLPAVAFESGRITLIRISITGSHVQPEVPNIGLLLGYWYPDELEPKYRMIKVPGCCSQSIRIRYRKRTNKITSIHDVINLRSRMALENMFRAIVAQKTDPQMAVSYETIAIGYIAEEQAANNPIAAGSLQFDPGTCPAVTDNIQ